MPILRKAGGRRLTPVAEGGCGGPIVPRGRERNKAGGAVVQGLCTPRRGAGPSSSRVASAREAPAWSYLGGQRPPPPLLQPLLASHGPFVGIFRLQPKGTTSVQAASPQIAPQEQLTSASPRCRQPRFVSAPQQESKPEGKAKKPLSPSDSVHGWNKRLFARCGSH